MLINSRFLPIIGGGETYTLELMRYLSDKGNEVHLVTQERGFGRDNWGACKIHYVEGFDDDDLHIQKVMPALRRILDQVNPDLVHVHNIMPYFVYSSIVDEGEFPTVLTIHNTPHTPHRLFGGFRDYKSERLFVRQLLGNKKYDRLVVGSKYYLDSYARVLPEIQQKAEVARYFPPSMTAGPCSAKVVDTSKNETRLLFPSRILRRKGIEECLTALSKLPERFILSLPSFVHTEDPSYKATIERKIHELGIRNRLRIPSEITTPMMMKNYYRDADIVLIPSHYEGFGIVAVEAMSWGVPVIASGAGGLSEIVVHGKNGVIVEPESVTGLVEAINLIASDKVLAQKLTEGGICTVRDTFSLEKHMEQIESIYKGCYNNHQEMR